ncbi:hypothetical protein AB4Y30_06165 [Ornithinibacillus sp. 4-3]|uniref:Uncharacterized protein n=1 Tax=Ornithinibacillus sp. 4-3 TaxID=3231488 RepID=A0AB39HS05_9BACI
MRRKIIAIGVILILLLVSYFSHKLTFTTYKDLMEDFIDENAEVIEIKIASRSDIQQRSFSTVIESEELIEKILKEPSMQLKKTNEPLPILENSLFIEWKRGTGVDGTETTKENSNSIFFNQNYLDIGGNHYKIFPGLEDIINPFDAVKVLFRGEDPRNLFDVVRYAELEWVEN